MFPALCRVTVSVSTIMNKTAPLQLDSAAAVAVYVSSLIMHDVGNFAKHNFSIRSIYIRKPLHYSVIKYVSE